MSMITGTVIFNKKSMLYGRKENHGKRAYAPFRGLPAATGFCISQQLEQSGFFERLCAWIH